MKNIGNWLFKLLFPAKYRKFHEQGIELSAAWALARYDLGMYSMDHPVRKSEVCTAIMVLHQRVKAAEAQCVRKPAHITLAGGMSELAIAEQLRGTESTPTVKAICAHLSAKIVLLSDRATDAPRTVCQVKGETIAGYSAEERLHDAGGASYLAEALGEIQDLTKATLTAEEDGKAA